MVCENVKFVRARKIVNICVNPAEPAISTHRCI